MPGQLHEVLVDLFRCRPRLVEDLLSRAAGPMPPAHDAVRTEDPDAVEIAPVARRADTVILFEKKGKPVLAAIVEPQLRKDEEKRQSWPNYLTSLWARHGCDVVLLVVALSKTVAQWAARPIRMGHPGFELVPIVVGPATVPWVENPHEARRDPEMAVLSALAHGNQKGGIGVETRAPRGRICTEAERGIVYADVVLAALKPRARKALEAMLKTKKYEFQSEFARKYIAEGTAAGSAAAKAEAILAFLEARGLAVSPEERARIEACTDIETLDAWIVRAATARSTDRIFESTGEDPASR